MWQLPSSAVAVLTSTTAWRQWLPRPKLLCSQRMMAIHQRISLAGSGQSRDLDSRLAVTTRTAPTAGPAGPLQSQGSSRHLLASSTDAGNCQIGSEDTTYLNCGSDTPACCTSSTCYYNPTGAHIARSASNSGSSSSSSASASSSSSDDDGSSSSSSSASSSSSSGDSNEPGVCQDNFYLGCC